MIRNPVCNFEQRELSKFGYPLFLTGEEMFARTFAAVMAVFFGALGAFLSLQKQFQESAGAFGCAILWTYCLVIKRSERNFLKRHLR